MKNLCLTKISENRHSVRYRARNQKLQYKQKLIVLISLHSSEVSKWPKLQIKEAPQLETCTCTEVCAHGTVTYQLSRNKANC